jgi:hypothetical protein
MKIFFIVLAFFASVKYGLVSCTKAKVPVAVTVAFLTAECPDTLKFSETIEPLILANCATSGCHDASNAGGYTLTTYEQIKDNSSAILNSITVGTGSPLSMPYLLPQLDGGDIQKVKCWINQGKLNN